MAATGYRVEGWTSRLKCVRVRWAVRPATVLREAAHQVLDLGASTVWVYGPDGGPALYTMNEALRWQKHAGDESLVAAIETEE